MESGGFGSRFFMSTKWIRVTEAAVQVAAGTVLIFLSNLLLFPLIGIEATVQANAVLVLANTVVAFVKSYAVRAAFRRLDEK
jgi:hypothetical protein